MAPESSRGRGALADVEVENPRGSFHDAEGKLLLPRLAVTLRSSASSPQDPHPSMFRDAPVEHLMLGNVDTSVSRILNQSSEPETRITRSAPSSALARENSLMDNQIARDTWNFEDISDTLQDRQAAVADDTDDSEWEIVHAEEHDESTDTIGPIPTVVYQPSTFTTTMQQYIDQYSLSESQQQSLRGAWALLQLGGGFAYAVVSESVTDIGDWATQRQFGCDLDELPTELRMRLMQRMPASVRQVLLALRPGGYVLRGHDQRREVGTLPAAAAEEEVD